VANMNMFLSHMDKYNYTKNQNFYKYSGTSITQISWGKNKIRFIKNLTYRKYIKYMYNTYKAGAKAFLRVIEN